MTRATLRGPKVLLIPEVLIAGKQDLEAPFARPRQAALHSPGPAIPAHPSALPHVLARTGPVELGCWRRTGSLSDRRGLVQRTLGKGENVVHLLSTDRRKPLQKLVDGRTLVEVLKQGGNRKARTPEAPCPAKLPGCPVDSAAKAPVHICQSIVDRTNSGNFGAWLRIGHHPSGDGNRRGRGQ